MMAVFFTIFGKKKSILKYYKIGHKERKMDKMEKYCIS